MGHGERRISTRFSRIPSSILLLVGLWVIPALLIGQTQVAAAEGTGQPQVYSIVPAYGYPGQRLEFSIRGLNLPVDEAVTLSLVDSTCIMARNCYVNDNHTITGQLCIADGASRGWYELSAYLPSSDVAVGTLQFEVQAMPSPEVTSVEPQNVKQGERCTLSIGGKGFPEGATATISFPGGSGIAPIKGQVQGWNMITADVFVGDAADLGPRDLLVSFDDPQVTAAPFDNALKVKQANWADLKLLGVAATAWFGGIVSGLLGFLDSEKGKLKGKGLRQRWSWGKFFRTFLVSAIAGVGFAVGYQQLDSLQVVHFFVAFLGGAGGDALSNRFLGATTETPKASSSPT